LPTLPGRRRRLSGRSKRTSLANALKKNAAERKQLKAEVAALNDNNDNNDNNRDTASNRARVYYAVMKRAEQALRDGITAPSTPTVAELEAKLKEQEEKIEYQQGRTLAAEQALSFSLGSWLGSDFIFQKPGTRNRNIQGTLFRKRMCSSSSLSPRS
jgi:hypothetical protein